MGLVLSRTEAAQPPAGSTGSLKLDAQNAFASLTKSPRQRFYLSPFGPKFMEFIKGTSQPNE
jgi:hypothetical protein